MVSSVRTPPPLQMLGYGPSYCVAAQNRRRFQAPMPNHSVHKYFRRMIPWQLTKRRSQCMTKLRRGGAVHFIHGHTSRPAGSLGSLASHGDCLASPVGGWKPTLVPCQIPSERGVNREQVRCWPHKFAECASPALLPTAVERCFPIRKHVSSIFLASNVHARRNKLSIKPRIPRVLSVDLAQGIFQSDPT